MTNGEATPVNQDLNALHGMLIATNEKLSKSLDTITDPELASAVVTEMREVVHRLDLVQSLLFTAASRRIEKAVDRVRDAHAALTASIKQIEDKISFVKQMSSFLAVVDKAIDLVKIV